MLEGSHGLSHSSAMHESLRGMLWKGPSRGGPRVLALGVENMVITDLDLSSAHQLSIHTPNLSTLTGQCLRTVHLCSVSLAKIHVTLFSPTNLFQIWDAESDRIGAFSWYRRSALRRAAWSGASARRHASLFRTVVVVICQR